MLSNSHCYFLMLLELSDWYCPWLENLSVCLLVLLDTFLSYCICVEISCHSAIHTLSVWVSRVATDLESLSSWALEHLWARRRCFYSWSLAGFARDNTECHRVRTGSLQSTGSAQSKSDCVLIDGKANFSEHWLITTFKWWTDDHSQYFHTSSPALSVLRLASFDFLFTEKS